MSDVRVTRYIERAAAQKIICGWCGICQHPTVEDLEECEICPQFSLIPDADVRPVLRGEWWKSLNPGFSPFDDSGEYRYRCNRCGHTQNCELNFCPHCGADMRGGDGNG